MLTQQAGKRSFAPYQRVLHDDLKGVSKIVTCMQKKILLLLTLFIIGCSTTANFQGAHLDTYNVDTPKNKVYLSVQNTKINITGAFTDMTAFNGTYPGPLLFGRKNEIFEAHVKNNADTPITVHWHGLQLPNSEDGVPGLTQEPQLPGEERTYRFNLTNSGTYWYHTHFESAEMIERGLQGPFIVGQESPLSFDGDRVLVLDDIRLDKYGNHDRFGIGVMHGRFGNVLTVNGKSQPDIPIIREGRQRLRIINTANARTFQLTTGTPFTVIGRGIGYVEPYNTSMLTLSPGQRYDVIIDSEGKQILLQDESFEKQTIAKLTPMDNPKHVSGSENIVKDVDLDLQSAEVKNVELRGERRGRGLAWLINGKADSGEFTLERGKTYVFNITNTQGQVHPMHLHGQKFKVIDRTRGTIRDEAWLDTVNVLGGENVKIAFKAEGKGNWAFHCHILEHAEAGMMSTLKIKDSV